MRRTCVGGHLEYDQNAVISGFVVGLAINSNAKSLLDIGAGGPITAIPISQAVSRYLAVEVDRRQAECLRQAGLDVMCGSFPLNIRETFDLVLASHSIPENGIHLYPDFLSSAWKCVGHEGKLAIISFKGSQGDLYRVRAEITGRTEEPSLEYQMVMELLGRYGSVSVERFNSYLASPRIGDITRFIQVAFFGQEADRTFYRAPIEKILRDRYYSGGVVTFPTEHICICCCKEV